MCRSEIRRQSPLEGIDHGLWDSPGHIGTGTNSKAPATFRPPAPESSQHAEEILLEMGYTREDIEQLKTEETIA